MSTEIHQITAPDVVKLRDAGTPFEFIDVRTEEERAIARIEGARLLDQTYHDELLALDRGTPLVLHCHSGIRSQNAAEYFSRQGFTEVYNLAGGIDAWSVLVDPTVPRY
jgi:monothiol glutaredoxin